MKNSPIERAKSFLLDGVIETALASSTLDQKIKTRVTNSKRWIKQFAKVGDLLVYLQRFNGEQSPETLQALKASGLETFEDVLPKFEAKFSMWSSDRSTPESFIVGQQYNSFEILIFVGMYDTRAGGMFLLGDKVNPQGVVIKATLTGGMYPNEWIAKGRSLKYYLKSRRGIFGEKFQENAAIIANPQLPIMCFVRDCDDTPFTYQGIFESKGVTAELDGSKWFTLERSSGSVEVNEVIDEEYERQQLAARVIEAETLTDEQLAKKAAEAPKKPNVRTVQVRSHERSPYVIASVLRRAAGICEGCTKPAPFTRRSDGTPYLEVHHKTRLADNGDDSVENAVALCPNCHRFSHSG